MSEPRISRNMQTLLDALESAATTYGMAPTPSSLIPVTKARVRLWDAIAALESRNKALQDWFDGCAPRKSVNRKPKGGK